MEQQEQEDDSSSNPATVRLLALLAQCWTHLKSDGLAGEFAAWLFGDADAIAQPELNGVVTHPLKHALLTLCLSKDQVRNGHSSRFDVRSSVLDMVI